MASLNSLIADLPADEQDRITRALALMNRQAIGSERYREDVQCWKKEDKSPVTIADLLHQSQVQQLLADHFPDDGLVCEEPRSMQEQVVEEAAKVSARYYGVEVRPEVIDVPESGRVTWMLDPIDGTKGYLGGRYYAIALGYFVDGAPRFGAMAVPHSPNTTPLGIDNALAFAIHGKGTWIAKISESGDLDFEPLKTAQGGYTKPYRVAVSLAHGGNTASAFAPGEIEPVKMDSQAKYLAVAANEIDAYVRRSRDDGGTDVTWDHMPGWLIASEAGCTVCQFDGAPFNVAPEAVIRFNGGLVCHRGPASGVLSEMIQGLTQ